MNYERALVLYFITGKKYTRTCAVNININLSRYNVMLSIELKNINNEKN